MTPGREMLIAIPVHIGKKYDLNWFKEKVNQSYIDGMNNDIGNDFKQLLTTLVATGKKYDVPKIEKAVGGLLWGFCSQNEICEKPPKPCQVSFAAEWKYW